MNIDMDLASGEVILAQNEKNKMAIFAFCFLYLCEMMVLSAVFCLYPVGEDVLSLVAHVFLVVLFLISMYYLLAWAKAYKSNKVFLTNQRVIFIYDGQVRVAQFAEIKEINLLEYGLNSIVLQDGVKVFFPFSNLDKFKEELEKLYSETQTTFMKFKKGLVIFLTFVFFFSFKIGVKVLGKNFVPKNRTHHEQVEKTINEKNPQTNMTKEVSDYIIGVKKQIKSNWQPAKFYKSVDIVVMYKIQQNGTVTDIYVQKSSGDAEFDACAIKAVEKSSPFAPLPKELHSQAPIDMQFTFNYNFHKAK